MIKIGNRSGGKEVRQKRLIKDVKYIIQSGLVVVLEDGNCLNESKSQTYMNKMQKIHKSKFHSVLESNNVSSYNTQVDNWINEVVWHLLHILEYDQKPLGSLFTLTLSDINSYLLLHESGGHLWRVQYK